MSTSPAPRNRFRGTRVSRFLQARWRLMFATGVCIVLIALLPEDAMLESRFLINWDAGVAFYLVLVTVMILRSDLDRIRRESALQGEGRITIPVLTVIAAMASLGAIIFWLRNASASETVQPPLLALMFLTTLLSWIFVHVMFAMHYAHEYYAQHRGQGGGMRFPGTKDPDYWDFIYFSFVIGTSTAASDVAITSCTIRRTATAHGLISFVFNLTMIALTVSIAGDAISMK